MPEGLVIVGAGGFGREVLDIVEAIESAGADLGFVGFLDDGDVNLPLLERRGVRLLGRTADFARVADRYVIGVGSSSARVRLAAQLDNAGGRSQTLIHPQATIGSETHLGPGSVVAAGARITTNVRLGRHTQIHVNATVGHDTRLGEFVTVLPGATVGGDAALEDGVTVGAGANVLNGVVVGARAFVGAGAVVTRDVESGAMTVGVPARAVQASPQVTTGGSLAEFA